MAYASLRKGYPLSTGILNVPWRQASGLRGFPAAAGRPEFERPGVGSYAGPAARPVGVGRAVVPHSRSNVTDLASYNRREFVASGLGIAPVLVTTFAPAIGKTIGGLFRGSSTGASNATFDTWYNEAAQGSQHSVDLLWVRAGRRPERSIPMSGATIAPTQASKDHADQLLQRLVAGGAIDGMGNVTPGVTYGTGAANATLAPTPTITDASNAPGWLDQFLQAVSQTPGGQQLITRARPAIVAGVKQNVATDIATFLTNNSLLVLGAGGALLFLLARKGR